MVRTQIQLTDDQARRLRRLASERGASIAALVREGVERILEEEGTEAVRRRALSVVGAFRGGAGENVSEEHDRYLGKALADWRSS
jgi:Arc/MetJ-type ribon-helix-helix transcriptional regulator